MQILERFAIGVTVYMVLGCIHRVVVEVELYRQLGPVLEK